DDQQERYGLEQSSGEVANQLSASPVGPDVDAELLTFLVQMTALEPKSAGGFGHPVAVSIQLVEHGFTFESGDPIGQRTSDRWKLRAHWAPRHHLAYRERINRPVGQQQESLDNVPQLPHVAWP